MTNKTNTQNQQTKQKHTKKKPKTPNSPSNTRSACSAGLAGRSGAPVRGVEYLLQRVCNAHKIAALLIGRVQRIIRMPEQLIGGCMRALIVHVARNSNRDGEIERFVLA